MFRGNVRLPPDAPLGATNTVTQRAETIIRQEAERFGNEHHHKDVLKSLTTFIGGGGPRFGFLVDPERQQLNYAQILVEVSDKHLTNEFVGPLQTALSREVPGARVDVRQLENRSSPLAFPSLFEFQVPRWKFCTASLANSRRSFARSQTRLGYETTGESLP